MVVAVDAIVTYSLLRTLCFRLVLVAASAYCCFYLWLLPSLVVVNVVVDDCVTSHVPTFISDESLDIPRDITKGIRVNRKEAFCGSLLIPKTTISLFQ